VLAELIACDFHKPGAPLADAGVFDAGPSDSGASRFDAGFLDAGPPDAGLPDGGFVDGGQICPADGLPDGGWCLEADFDWPAGTVGAVAISGTSETDVWMVANQVAHRNASGWSLVPAPPGAFVAVSASQPDNSWAAGDVLMHWDGSIWSTVSETNSGGLPWQAIWTSGPDDVWAASYYELDHWDGSTWTALDGGENTLDALGGTGPNDVWVGGYKPGSIIGGCRRILHFDGTDWTTTFDGCTRDDHDGEVLAIAAPPSGAIWAVGIRAAVDFPTPENLVWDGLTWQDAPVPQPEYPTGIWAAWSPGGGELWVVADKLYRMQGSTFEAQSLEQQPGAVWGTQQLVWTVTYQGQIWLRRR
jgi:hypothetical protein